jgi:hypothetical protein
MGDARGDFLGVAWHGARPGRTGAQQRRFLSAPAAAHKHEGIPAIVATQIAGK